MRSICLSFQVHQPVRLRTYRFFNIGDDHQYYDEYQNRTLIRRVAERSYLPANRMFLDLIREYGKKFKVSFSVSGTALDQFQQHAPEVIQSFRQLAETGCVEFLAGPYAHSLASLSDKGEFVRQVELHRQAIRGYFGQEPVSFRNSEMVYSDRIGELVAEMGFSAMITEGAKHILGWKSPNYLYCNAINPKLKVLLRNFRLSDDIAFRFSTQSWSEWPLTTEKFTGWLNRIDPAEEVVNLFLDYETIGERQGIETGIFDFFRSLPDSIFRYTDFSFATPSEAAQNLQPVSAVHVPYPISWTDEERDLTSWLGNELQEEAFSKLYGLSERVKRSGDPELIRDWNYLQTADHLYYMSTKWFSDGTIRHYFNPYPSPYEAFINYMNVLSDFIIRTDEATVQSPAPASPVRKRAVRTVKKATVPMAVKKEKGEKTAKKPVKKKISSAKKSTPVSAEKKKPGRPKKAAPEPEKKRPGRPKKETPSPGKEQKKGARKSKKST